MDSVSQMLILNMNHVIITVILLLFIYTIITIIFELPK